MSKRCAQLLYDFENYAVIALGGAEVRVEWFVGKDGSKGRMVVAVKEIEKDTHPFYMRFRVHRGKKRETATDEQFALEAKLDVSYEEDSTIAGEVPQRWS